MKTRRTIFIFFLGMLLPLSIWGSNPLDSVRLSLSAMMSEYPESTLLDIYKSAFQNKYGPGHIVSDVSKAKGYLDWELKQPFRHENPLYEPTIPDGQFYRVNLSVINDTIVPYDLFFSAFLDSVKEIEMPTIESWTSEWQAILSEVAGMGLNLPSFDDDKNAIADRLAKGIYQGEHSRIYVEKYDPHYRIIRKDIFEERLKPLIDLYQH